MNDLFQPDSNANGPEPLDEGGTWLLDLVSAVDHLRRGYRPGFTVWDALAEAINCAATAVPDDTSASGRLSSVLMTRSADHAALQRAVRRWVLVMADRYNSGHHWPLPGSRRSYPPPLLTPE